MTRKTRVYVVNNKNYDLSKAELFGDLKILYEGQPSDIFMTSKHAHFIKEKLKDAESGDYLVAVGNMVLVLVAFGVMMEKFGFVNLLLFDVRNLVYIPRTVPRYQLQSGGANV